MNLTQANELRASLGLAPMVAGKDSKLAKRKQAQNQAARAARDQEIRTSRNKGKR